MQRAFLVVCALGVVAGASACSAIVGIGDLTPGGSSGGTSSSGTSGSGSSSGSSSSGSSSGASSSGTSSGTASSSGTSSSGTSSSGSGSSGGIAAGEACPTGAGCASGLVCVGACRLTCTTVGDSCSNEGVCEEYGTTFACTIPCKPLGGNCASGLACEVGVLNGTTEALSDCEVPGTLTTGAPCTTYGACVQGDTCPTAAESSATCAQWCDTTYPCTSGTCENYVTFNGVEYGYCD